MTLHEQLIQETKEMVEHIAECESVSSFRLDIEISGRVHDGDILIEYKLGQGYSDYSRVVGKALGPVVQEFLRRHGWNERHAPIAISFVPQVVHEHIQKIRAETQAESAKSYLNDEISF